MFSDSFLMTEHSTVKFIVCLFIITCILMMSMFCIDAYDGMMVIMLRLDFN